MRKFIDAIAVLLEAREEIPQTEYGYWITPEGKFIVVPYQSHGDVAKQNGFPTKYKAMEEGWIRIQSVDYLKKPAIFVEGYGDKMGSRALRALRGYLRDNDGIEISFDIDDTNGEHYFSKRFYDSKTAIAAVNAACAAMRPKPAETAVEPITEAVEIPETHYGYWIKSDGEFVVVDHEEHQKVLNNLIEKPSRFNRVSYGDGYALGWIRVLCFYQTYYDEYDNDISKEDKINFDFCFCKQTTTMNALRSLRRLARDERFALFTCDMYTKGKPSEFDSTGIRHETAKRFWNATAAITWAATQCRDTQSQAPNA